MSKPKVLLAGVGAIGATVAAWLVGEGIDVTIMDVGETADALRRTGITVFEIGSPESTRKTVKARVVARPGECPDVDIVLLAVKNYNLFDVAQLVLEDLGNGKIIVSLANGRENQEILPRFFPRVIYCVVGYNARRDDAGVVGYQKKGPLLIGTPDNSLKDELHFVQQILGRGCSTEIVDRLQDAVHTKIVMNLTNALDALVGHGYQTLSSFPVYQHLLSQTLWEGVRVVKAAGYHEHKIAGMPPFAVIRASALLPGWLTRPVVRRRLRAMVMSSMTQDVMLRGAFNTELESITGYLVKLASQVGVPAPYNETIYELGQKHFHPGFTPLRCEDVLRAVQETKAKRDSIQMNAGTRA